MTQALTATVIKNAVDATRAPNAIDGSIVILHRTTDWGSITSSGADRDVPWDIDQQDDGGEGGPCWKHWRLDATGKQETYRLGR